MDEDWQERLREFRESNATGGVATTLADLFADVLGRLQRLFAAEAVILLLLDDARKELVVRASRGVADETIGDLRIPLGGMDVDSQSAGQDAVEVAGEALRARQIGSLLGAPLQRAGRLLGVVEVVRVGPRAWTDVDAWFLLLAADRIVVELEHVQLHEIEATDLCKLRAAERRYRSLVEGLNHTIVWEAQLPSLRVTHISDQTQELLGIPISAWMVEGGLAARVPAKERAEFAAKIRQCMETKCDASMEHHLLTADGSAQWFHTGIRFIAEDGLSLLRGISVDISRVKTAEAAQRESEEHFRLLIEWVEHYAILGIDLDARISSWNAGAERLLGYTDDEIVGKPLATIYPADQVINGQHERDLALARESGAREVETKWLRKDGSTFLGHGVITALFDEHRTLRGFSTVLHDVTKERRRFNHQQFLADTMGDMVASSKMEDMLQRLADHAVPSLADLCVVYLGVHGERLRRVAAAHLDSAQVQKLQRLADRLPRYADALLTAETPLLIRAITEDTLVAVSQEPELLDVLRGLHMTSGLVVPLVARGRFLGTLGLATTAGSRRRLDDDDLAFALEVAGRVALAIDNARLYREADEANQRKDEFLAMLAHELRNPLTSISMSMQVLEHLEANDPRADRHRMVIKRQVLHLDRLVGDLLDVSRIRSGKFALAHRRVDLREIVENVVEVYRTRAEARRQSLQADLGGEALPVWGDPARLEQAVGNLVENAIKYTPPGGHIRVAVGREQEQAVLRVEDDGIGINQDLLPRVFESFVQAHPEAGGRRRGEGGLGLGLALVRRIVEMHEGSVSAASEGPGRGSAFEVRLPLLLQGDLSGGTDGSTRRVLVVEDSEDTREAVRTLLELRGFDVHLLKPVDAEALDGALRGDAPRPGS